MTYKKINTKKFISKFSQNQLLSDLFAYHEADNIPKISGASEDGKIAKHDCEEWYAFYMGLDDDMRVEVYESIEKINYLANFEANKIYTELKAKTKETARETSREILAENYFDKSLAFYLDYNDRVDDAIHVYSFYKISGYKRYEAKGQVTEDLNVVDENIIERFENIIEAQLGTYVKVESKTLTFDDMYFTKISYRDGKEKEMHFVYVKALSEVIVKASGGKQVVFEYAESYIKKLTGFAMDPKEAEYDLDVFIDKNYKSLIDENAKLTNPKYPLDNESVVYDWYIKSIKLSRATGTLAFTFTKSDEIKNMMPLYLTLLDSGIDVNIYSIDSITIAMSVKTGNIKVSKKNMSLSIKKNSTNLSILKKEHRVVDKLLKDKNVFVGYKVIELQSKR